MLNPKFQAVIKGLDALHRYCVRRWKQYPHFIEHFARMNEVKICKIEAKAPTDEHWTDYYLLMLYDDNGYLVYTDPSGVAKEINKGTLKPMNV